VRRLAHEKLFSRDAADKTLALFSVCQKLLAKNIPVTAWPQGIQAMAFPADKYLGLFLDAGAGEQPLREYFRALDGVLCVRTDDQLLGVSQGVLSLGVPVFDRLGESLLAACSRPLTPPDLLFAANARPSSVDEAVEAVRCLTEGRVDCLRPVWETVDWEKAAPLLLRLSSAYPAGVGVRRLSGLIPDAEVVLRNMEAAGCSLRCDADQVRLVL
jgi:hypothetical protein